MHRPPAQQALMQAEFEELARQGQDLEARELEVQRMTRTRNLNIVREARVTNATSAVGNRPSRKKEQAPRCASSKIASLRSLTLQGMRSLILVTLRLCRPLLSVLRTRLART